MKYIVLGTGIVGQTIAAKLFSLDYEVWMGTRDVEKTRSRTEKNQMSGDSFASWYAGNSGIHLANYADLPSDCDGFINATSGGASLDALNSVGNQKLKGKIILDIANPLDFSKGMPPSLSVCNTDSLAEQIQRSFPEAFVVKSLNTMNCFLMMKLDHVGIAVKNAEQIILYLSAAMKAQQKTPSNRCWKASAGVLKTSSTLVILPPLVQRKCCCPFG